MAQAELAALRTQMLKEFENLRATNPMVEQTYIALRGATIELKEALQVNDPRVRDMTTDEFLMGELVDLYSK